MKKITITCLLLLSLMACNRDDEEKEIVNETRTMNFYTIKDKQVSLTVHNLDLTTLELSDSGIQVEWILKEECLFVPKFTFNIVGRTMSIINQLGTIGHKTHSFNLNWTNSDGTIFNFDGFLEADVFDNSNTGFFEGFQLNGVIDIEYLGDHNVSVDRSLPSFSIEDVLKKTITDNTSISNVTVTKSFAESFGYCGTDNLVDDDNQVWDGLTYIKEVCKTFNMFGIVFNNSNSIAFYDMATMASIGGNDYSLLEHRGINESISIGEIINDYTVKVSNYDMNIDITPDMQTKHFSLNNDETYKINTSIRGNKNDGGVFHSSNKWWQYERIMGYYVPEDFSGWSFPKYSAGETITEISDWWDPQQIFTYTPNNPIMGTTEPKRYAKRGMYPATFRTRIFNQNNEITQGWSSETDVSVISTLTSENGQYYYSPTPDDNMVVMRYKGNISVPDNSVLLINYSLSGTPLVTWNGGDLSPDRPAKMHEDSRDWTTSIGGNDDTTFSWGVCPVYIDRNNDPDWSPNGMLSTSKLKWRVKFQGKYWNGSSWSDSDSYFDIGIQGNDAYINEDEFKAVKNNNPNSRYSQGSGYEIVLNGGGELIIELVVSEIRSEIYFKYWHVFMKDLSVKFELPMGLADTIRSREDVIYTTLTNTSHNEYDPDITIMFHSDDNYDMSRSQLFYDPELKQKIDKYNYTIGSFTVNEKLEYHLIRMATQYRSGMKTIKDILWMDDIRMFYTYKGDLLWLSGLKLDVMNEEATTSFSYNSLSSLN